MGELSFVDCLLFALIVLGATGAMYLGSLWTSSSQKSDGSVHSVVTEFGAIIWTDDEPEATTPETRLQSTLAGVFSRYGYTSLDHFLAGAERAHGMITTAFVKGDMSGCRQLLHAGVLEVLEDEIAQRKRAGETLEARLVRLKRRDVVDAAFDGDRAQIAVRFVTEMVLVTRDRSGRPVAGDPSLLTDIAEVWTFERQRRARDPNWLLVATVAEEPAAEISESPDARYPAAPSSPG